VKSRAHSADNYPENARASPEASSARSCLTLACSVANRLLFPCECIFNRSEIGRENTCRLSARLGSSRPSQGILARNSREFILLRRECGGVGEVASAYYGQFSKNPRLDSSRDFPSRLDRVCLVPNRPRIGCELLENLPVKICWDKPVSDFLAKGSNGVAAATIYLHSFRLRRDVA